MKKVLVLFMCLNFYVHSQNTAPQPIPCLIINASNSQSLSGIISNENCIEIGKNQQNQTTIFTSNNVKFKARNEITIENTHIKPSSNAYAHLKIERNDLEVAWFEPIESTNLVKKHNKFEVGLKLPSNIDDEIKNFLINNSGGINPFNPNEISVNATFIPPSGASINRYGFYYQPYIRNINNNSWQEDTTSYPWRIRFAPNQIGLWSVNIKVIVNGNQIGNQIGLTFKCIPSEHKGYVSRSYNGDESDRYLYLSETGEAFFTIGHNIAHSDYVQLTPQSSLRHQQWLAELAANGGNFYRLELGEQNALPDWDNYKNYNTKMDEMWEYDQLIDLSQSLNLYFILFRHHAEVNYATWPNNWEENPYRLGLNLSNFTSYFTNQEAMQWQKNCLRYIFSRWGYTPNFAFYGYSEIDNWIAPMKETEGISDESALYYFKYWNLEQINYMKNSLGYSKILSLNTYSGENSPIKAEKLHSSSYIFSYLDVIGFHKYADDKKSNWDRYDLANDLWKKWKKPVIMEEIGNGDDFIQAYCCTDIDFHNNIWASSFSGSTGVGMHWWWDRGIHDFGFYTQYKNIKSFFSGEDIRERHYNAYNWKDKATIKNATLETFYLKSKDNQRIIGWLHNATYFWANLSSINSCVAHLILSNNLNSPCIMDDGYTIPPPPLGKNYVSFVEGPPVSPIENQLSINNNPQFTIANVKYNFGIKKHWYRIDFYNTRGNPDNIPIFTATQVLHADASKRLRPHVPNLNGYHPDYAYKVTYLGLSKNPPSGSNAPQLIQNNISRSPNDSLNTLIKTDNVEVFIQENSLTPFNVEVYPNPNDGVFSIVSDAVINEVSIFKTNGLLLYSFKDINTLKYDIKLEKIEKGYLIVKISTSNGVVTKKIIIL
ncbi:MAG: DUF5060 domain-containing protein [Crocinitomicaceae bacterium]|nr:DUF5060 domain-containing protein [Crocinitomicaceae bacterium]